MEINPFTGRPNPPSQEKTAWLFFGFLFLACVDVYVIRNLGFQFFDALVVVGLAMISCLGMLACAVKINKGDQ
jgi:hypothetical protein